MENLKKSFFTIEMLEKLGKEFDIERMYKFELDSWSNFVDFIKKNQNNEYLMRRLFGKDFLKTDIKG